MGPGDGSESGGTCGGEESGQAVAGVKGGDVGDWEGSDGESGMGYALHLCSVRRGSLKLGETVWESIPGWEGQGR